MDLDRLTRGEQLVGVGALVLVLVSFLHWLGGKIVVSVPGGSQLGGNQQFARSAWSYTMTTLAVLLALGLLGYVVALTLLSPSALARVSPRLAARIVVVVSVLTFLLVFVKFLVGANLGLSSFGLPSTSGLALRVSFTRTREVGAYAGLVASAVIAAGGILNLRTAGAV